MSAKEEIEGAVEPGEVFVTVDEEAAQRRRDVLPVSDPHPLQRPNGIDQPAMVDVEPRVAEQPAEQEDVSGQTHDGPATRASARVSIARPRSPRTDSMSS